MHKEMQQLCSMCRLEELMKDFGHLNVVEVLMKCCCPQLPSAGAMATTG